jgi:hypothetical protein
MPEAVLPLGSSQSLTGTRPLRAAGYRSLPRLDAASFLFLTLLIWGIQPFARGIRFAGDDVNFLFWAWTRAGEPWGQQLLQKYPADGPTRALTFWPFVLATWSPAPAVFLQLFYAMAWLANALAIAYLARVLRPGSRLVPLVAGCLMATATSDYQTDVVVYGPHLFGVALFFWAVALLLRSTEGGWRTGPALLASALFAWSFFTAEYTYPAVPLVPVLAWFHSRSGSASRFWRSLAVVGVPFLTAAGVLVWSLAGPGSHATHATSVLTTHVPWPQWLLLFGRHLVHNLWPVEWAFRAVPPWYDNYAAAFPLAGFVVASCAGATWAGWQFYQRRLDESPATDETNLVPLVGAALAAVILVNLASTNPGGDYFVRSHFVSRGWTSLLLAFVLAAAARRPRVRLWAGAVFSLFVFFGIWGGVERQSYLLGYATNERRELASLIEAVPGIDPAADLLVIQPPGSPTFIAANNPNAVPFVYGDLSLWNRVVMAPNSGFDYSRVDGDVTGRIRILTNSKTERLVDPASCIIVFYSISQDRFVRLDQIPAGMLRGSDSFFSAYRPGRWLHEKTGTTPAAVLDFLAHGGPGDRSPRKKPLKPGMVSVAAMGRKVQADSLAPFALEPHGETYTAWLGSGRAEGYSSMFWADEPTVATVTIRIAPGPNRPVAEQLRTRLTGADGVEQLSSQPFELQTTTGAVTLNLPAGRTVFEVWLEGTFERPPAGSAETRSLNGYLERIFLQRPR